MGTPSELERQVGGMQLRLEVTDWQWVVRAQKIVQDILEIPVSVNDRTLTVLLDTTRIQMVSRVLNQLQTVGVPISNFAVETPSLDDVFLKMTVGKN